MDTERMYKESEKIKSMTKFICRSCEKVYEVNLPSHVWQFDCECTGLAIKEGYSIEGKDAEDIVALGKRRAENVRLTGVAREQAAQHSAQKEKTDPTITIQRPSRGYGPGTSGGTGPMRLPKSVLESIKEKGKGAIEKATGQKVE